MSKGTAGARRRTLRPRRREAGIELPQFRFAVRRHAHGPGRQHYDAIAKALRPAGTAGTEQVANARFGEIAARNTGDLGRCAFVGEGARSRFVVCELPQSELPPGVVGAGCLSARSPPTLSSTFNPTVDTSENGPLASVSTDGLKDWTK